jgi:DNA mismatch endonuclease (patch repair protein)
MADVHSRETRSYNMSRIKGKNTKPEMLVRQFLHAHGYRYRLHDKKLPGKPDIVLPKYKTVIFVHGCFWHHHENCKWGKIPPNNQEYWIPKLLGNSIRDKKHKKDLKQNGWKVLVIWECSLNCKSSDFYLNHLHSRILTTKRNA